MYIYIYIYVDKSSTAHRDGVKICVIRKTMCPHPGYCHNYLMAVQALEQIMMHVMYTEDPHCI